jgi:hypothetical protein
MHGAGKQLMDLLALLGSVILWIRYRNVLKAS